MKISLETSAIFLESELELVPMSTVNCQELLAQSALALALEIVALCIQALVPMVGQPLEGVSELSCGGLSQQQGDTCLQFWNPCESLSPDLLLENWECPEVTRGQVRTIWGVLEYFKVVLVKIEACVS